MRDDGEPLVSENDAREPEVGGEQPRSGQARASSGADWISCTPRSRKSASAASATPRDIAPSSTLARRIRPTHSWLLANEARTNVRPSRAAHAFKTRYVSSLTLRT
jgi:hypothetical protein